ncbi:hypothetical protein [uncultured Amnibacterium sp.]|uniref:hypothetical protein n=1 Tax=uncultured Amnibacterium sp. TaxID=1631851 RepID=UPI0035CA8C1A
MDPWTQRLFVVRDGSHDDAERREPARRVERRELERLRRGVAVDRAAFETGTPEEQHVVRMRGVAAVAPEPVVFSHFSAEVVHGHPHMRSRLARVHTTVGSATERGRDGVAGHVFPLLPSEVMVVGGLLVTTPERTVVDVAGAAPFGEGVMAADAVLRTGAPRSLLLQAADLAGPRQAARRIQHVIDFAHPGGEGANESLSRVGMLRLGIEPPELQHLLWDDLGFVAWLDFWFRRVRVGGEADGRVKYLDPALAKQGAGMAVWEEKRREDRVLPMVDGLARWGYREAADHLLLRPRLAAFGVVPPRRAATLADYAAAARDAVPRPRVPTRP